MVTRLIIIMLIIPPLAIAGSIKLQWDANKETDLAGYKVYKSRTGRKPFTHVATVTAPSTTVTLANISTALPHVFAVTAFNNTSSESGYSNRVKTAVPVTRQRARISGSITSGF